jgi:hypothetical protein
MKKILLTSLLSAGALGAYGQAQLLFTDYGNSLSSHIWSPSAGNAVIQGNSGANPGSADNSGYTGGNAGGDVPVGSTTYPGSVLIGGSATGANAGSDYANGNLWTVQLQALGDGAAGYNSAGVAESALLPVASYTTTMNVTAGGAGQFSNPNTPGAGIPNTPYTSSNPTADVALAAWYSGGGDTTLLAAQQDSVAGVWGESSEVDNFTVFTPNNLLPLGTSPNGNPPDLPTTSFNVAPTVSPEPSTIAFGVMGACAFLARRKKS